MELFAVVCIETSHYVSYQEYLDIFKDPKWNITWLIKILFTVIFAFMFLTIR